MNSFNNIFYQIDVIGNERLKGRSSKLLQLLMEHPNEWISQELICYCLPNYFTRKENNTGTNICSQIWDAVEDINNKTNIQVIINKRHYKIANKEEARNELKRKWVRDVLPKIERLNRLKQKIITDGNADIFTANDEELKFIYNFLTENQKISYKEYDYVE